MIHKVDHAIIMAAGMGTRLYPITKELPKPLVRVKGVRLIDTVIRGLQKNGITEIYIVVGYLKNHFKNIQEEYDGIYLIENPYYKKYNNIGSLYVAREYIGNAIILDGDQWIRNVEVLKPEFEYSGYNSVWTNEYTEEWLQIAENGIVKKCYRSGGASGWKLYGISRWTAEDGRKLKEHVEIEFEKNGNTDLYWDDVAMFCYPQEYKLGIWPMHNGDVVEIDSLEELINCDESYKKYREIMDEEV